MQTRQMQRVTAWPTPPWFAGNFFPEEHRAVGVDFTPSDMGPDVPTVNVTSGPASQALQWLRDQTKAPIDQSRALLSGSWMSIQTISPVHADRRLGVLAVALHLTMTKYGWEHPNFRDLRLRSERVVPYSGVVWNGFLSGASPPFFGFASGVLVAKEILGYFALSVLRCAGLHPLGGNDRAGDEAFDPCGYCPTWRMGKARGIWTVRIRARASEHLVLWLISRYRKTPLQRLVVCAGRSRPAFQQELAHEFGMTVPQELARFPRPLAASQQAEIPSLLHDVDAKR